MPNERLVKTGYPFEPHAEKYYCYVFDEEVTLGALDISKLMEENVKSEAPVFLSGADVMGYRV